MDQSLYIEFDKNRYKKLNTNIENYIHKKILSLLSDFSFTNISFLNLESNWSRENIINSLMKWNYKNQIKVKNIDIDKFDLSNDKSFSGKYRLNFLKKIENKYSFLKLESLIFLHLDIGNNNEFYVDLIENYLNSNSIIMILEHDNFSKFIKKNSEIYIKEIINLNKCYSPLTGINIKLFILTKKITKKIKLIETKNIFQSLNLEDCTVGINLDKIENINLSDTITIGANENIIKEFKKNNINKIFIKQNNDNKIIDRENDFSKENKIEVDYSNFISYSYSFDMLKLEKMLKKEKIELELLSDVAIGFGRISLRKSNKRRDLEIEKLKNLKNSIFIPSMPSSKTLVEFEHTDLKDYDYFYFELDNKTHELAYVKTFLNSKIGNIQLKLLSSGDFIKQLNSEGVKKIKIPIKNKKEQNDLVGIKNKLDILKSNLENLEANLNTIDKIDADSLFSNIPDHEINKLITSEESEIHEYKSSLRVDIFKKGKSVENYITENWLKTIVAFLNTKGGNLLIGISDSKEILGLEKDGFKSQDDIHKFIVDKIKSNIGLEYIDKYIFVGFINKDEKLICRIQCNKLPKSFVATFGDDIYVRAGPSSRNLTPKEVIEWQNTRKDT